jgi:hypothetical protein
LGNRRPINIIQFGAWLSGTHPVEVIAGTPRCASGALIAAIRQLFDRNSLIGESLAAHCPRASIR